MATFKDDILEAAKGEPIEAVVIGPWPTSYETAKGAVPPDRINQVVPWDQASAWLAYEYDDGFGGEDCHPILAWTATRVLFVHEYDGSTIVLSVPLLPSAVEPHFL